MSNPDKPILLPDELSPRKLPKSKVAGQRFLALYSKHGKDYDTYQQFCDAFSLKYGYFRKLRSQNEGFRQACEAIERKPVPAEPSTHAPRLARARWPNLVTWQGLFIERYRETTDRLEACAMVDKYWSEVEQALRDDEAFAAAFKSVEDEFVVRVEDAKKRKALLGTTAANDYLTAKGSELGKRKKSEERPAAPGGGGSTVTTYRELLERRLAQQAAREAALAEENPEASGPELVPS